MKQNELLASLNNASVQTIANKESKKNTDLDEARTHELVKQVQNRTTYGRYFLYWSLGVFSIATSMLLLLTAVHLYSIALDPEKLAALLTVAYQEIKVFIISYQSVIAVIATLAFGDKLKPKKA